MTILSDKETYLYVTTPLDSGDRKFFIERIDGEEYISDLFHFRLVLKTKDNQVDFKKILGKNICVTIESYKGKKRYINGLVTRFIQAENDGYLTTYFAEIRPWLWKLSLTQNSRIFQQKSVIDIISEIFKDLSLTDFSNKTKKTYAKREYCVQYQETALDFITRLMEDEGIFYFFEHGSEKHTLVLADNTDAHADCPNQTDVKFLRARPEGRYTDEYVYACNLEEAVISNKYAVSDYSFETPDTKLFTSVDGKISGGFRVFEYPAGFKKSNEGEGLANRRIESIELPQKTIEGQGSARSFIAGYKFNLKEHDRSDMNHSWVIRTLGIHASQERYENAFLGFPSEVPFHPPRTIKRPRIFGTQTALVVGKSGEEIWTDKYGRIKVQFYWDQEGKKDENSSCWVRVTQMWAGKNWGTMFIPRIGTEVIVNFLEGNPDHPIITGTVYNATQTVPYPLPGEKTKSTIKTNTSKGGGGYNEIRFEDKKDKEEIYIHAQKDENIVVEHDRTAEVKNDDTLTVTKNRTATIKEEHDSLTVEKGNRTVLVSKGNESLTVEKGNRTIKVNTGNETHEVKGTRDITVTGNETRKDKANYTIKVDGNLLIDVKGTITIKSQKTITVKANKSITTKAGTSITNKAGTSFTNKAGGNLTNKASVNLTNKAGAKMVNKASAMEQVNGGGMLQAKGGIVKIN